MRIASPCASTLHAGPSQQRGAGQPIPSIYGCPWVERVQRLTNLGDGRLCLQSFCVMRSIGTRDYATYGKRALTQSRCKSAAISSHADQPSAQQVQLRPLELAQAGRSESSARPQDVVSASIFSLEANRAKFSRWMCQTDRVWNLARVPYRAATIFGATGGRDGFRITPSCVTSIRAPG
jgi:hypothetical protein